MTVKLECSCSIPPNEFTFAFQPKFYKSFVITINFNLKRNLT